MSDEYIKREDAKAKKVYSNERHEYVVPVAELDRLPAFTEEEIASKRKDGAVVKITNDPYRESCGCCGALVYVHHKFCPYCGYRIIWPGWRNGA